MIRHGNWHRRAAALRPSLWVYGSVCAGLALILLPLHAQEFGPFGEPVLRSHVEEDLLSSADSERKQSGPTDFASEDFSWGSIDPHPESGQVFDAPVDGLHPWNHLPWLPGGRDKESGRHRGMGDPLVGTSWRNRPFHVGWMFGGFFGDDVVHGETKQHDDIIGGYRVGWDFDHYWGTEARVAFTNVDVTDGGDVSTSRNAYNSYWDANLLYYPWGDSRWRPYGSLGIGWGSFEFTSADGETIDKSLLTLPVGGGVKYFFQRWLALRVSVTDYLAIGRDPLSTMHNLTATADVEMHFGGRRTSYFPYSGSNHLW